jgi:anthranilate phosphoribosyltransferase
MQLLGVYDPALVEPLAKVLQNLGVVRGLVVCGGDGLDEITATGKTQVCEIRYKNIVKYEITPSDYGFKERTLSELIGGSPADNAQITKDILSGKEQGAKRDVVVLNAGFALYLGKDDCTVEECIHLADELIRSGKAYEKLEEFVGMSKEVTAL